MSDLPLGQNFRIGPPEVGSRFELNPRQKATNLLQIHFLPFIYLRQIKIIYTKS